MWGKTQVEGGLLGVLGGQKRRGEGEKSPRAVTITKIYYLRVRKWYNETHSSIQLIHINKNMQTNQLGVLMDTYVPALRRQREETRCSRPD